jgi:N-methylhydantoinase A
MPELSFHIGTDVGGTFTDLWARSSDGRTKVVKSPSTADVIGGIVAAVELAAQAFGLETATFCGGIRRFGHGTTVGLNALLTGRTAPTAIITTAGFADTLEIGRLRRQSSGLTEAHISDYFLRGAWPPIVPRRRVFEVAGRIGAEGEELEALDEVGAVAVIERIAALDIKAVAICTLWATQNPDHERRLAALVAQRLPEVSLSVSHEVSPSVGEYARMSTTAANAALRPVASDYVARLEDRLRDLGAHDAQVMLMTGAGGVLPAEHLRRLPVAALFSGPSAGVSAAVALGRARGSRNVLTLDVGGTSFDVGLIVEGRPLMTPEVALAGADIRYPTIDVRSIGAGGGSIAFVDGSDLHVGPQSAGADPGPACYGRGGVDATATDADLVLGVLDPDQFVGGTMTLDVDAAREAIRSRVAEPLGVSVERAAWSVRAVMDTKMADLLRQVTIARGHDPRDFAIFAGGGAGPSHAWALVRELGVAEFVVPATATAQSAFGTGTSDLRMTSERRVGLELGGPRETPADAAERLRAAVESASRAITEDLFHIVAADDRRVEVTAAMRFRGQAHTLDVLLDQDGEAGDWPQVLVTAFEAAYQTLFGAGALFRGAPVEIVGVRATGIGSLPAPSAADPGTPFRRTGSRPVVFDDPERPEDTAIWAVVVPAAGERVSGPAVVEYPGHTAVVPPGSTATVDDQHNLVVREDA